VSHHDSRPELASDWAELALLATLDGFASVHSIAEIEANNCSYELDLPAMPEQKRMAALLWSVEIYSRQLEELHRNITSLRAVARDSLMSNTSWVKFGDVVRNRTDAAAWSSGSSISARYSGCPVEFSLGGRHFADHVRLLARCAGSART